MVRYVYEDLGPTFDILGLDHEASIGLDSSTALLVDNWIAVGIHMRIGLHLFQNLWSLPLLNLLIHLQNLLVSEIFQPRRFLTLAGCLFAAARGVLKVEKRIRSGISIRILPGLPYTSLACADSLHELCLELVHSFLILNLNLKMFSRLN